MGSTSGYHLLLPDETRRSCYSESPWSNVVDMTVLAPVLSHFDITSQGLFMFKRPYLPQSQ